MKLPNLQFTVKDLKLRTAILFVFSLYILTFVVAPSAWAQEMQRSFTLSYPTLMHKLNPGQTAQGITKITNNSAATLTFKLAVRDYVVLDNNGTPTILPPNTLSNKYSASAWIAIYPETFTLKPGQKQTIVTTTFKSLPTPGRADIMPPLFIHRWLTTPLAKAREVQSIRSSVLFSTSH